MGNGNSSIAVKNDPTTIIKPLLKRPSVHPSTFIPVPINYPGYIGNYPIRHNANYLQTEYYSQAQAKSVSGKSLIIL